MIKLEYKLKFPCSTYSAYEIGNKLYVGGSDWNRRKILYTHKIAMTAKGILHILKKTKEKQGFVKEKELIFPNMVYPIVKLSKNLLFVGLKLGKKTFNIIDLEGNILKQKDDKIGNGVYGIEFNKNKNELIIATRTGKLEIIDASSLKIKKRIQISPKRTRLWSMKLDKKNQLLYLGDYNGKLYIIDRKKLKTIRKFDMIKLYKSHKKLKKGFAPALWAIEILGNKLFLGTRWGDIFVTDRNLNLEEKIKIGEDVTYIKKLSKSGVLVATRYGKLLTLNLKNHKIKKILEIKPSLQKENAIWNIVSIRKGFLVCFADGHICKFSKK